MPQFLTDLHVTPYCIAWTVISDIVFMLLNTSSVIGLAAWPADSDCGIVSQINELL